VHIIKESGETYRPKDQTTGGDLKLAGKPDPYAYIQLNPKVSSYRGRSRPDPEQAIQEQVRPRLPRGVEQAARQPEGTQGEEGEEWLRGLKVVCS